MDDFKVIVSILLDENLYKGMKTYLKDLLSRSDYKRVIDAFEEIQELIDAYGIE